MYSGTRKPDRSSKIGSIDLGHPSEIHGRGQPEGGGEAKGHGGAGDGYLAVFERLLHHHPLARVGVRDRVTVPSVTDQNATQV